MVLLSVLPVLIRSKSGWELTYALLDSASESTLIQADLATQLELQDRDSHVKLMTIHGQDPDFGTRATSFTITSLDHSVTYEVERALIMPKLNVSDRKLNWPKEKNEMGASEATASRSCRFYVDQNTHRNGHRRCPSTA